MIDQYLNKVINADCLDIMKEMPEHEVDMILCDLPYSCSHNSWDILIPYDKLWECYEHIIKDNGAIVLFGQGRFTAQLICSNLKMYRYSLIWEKNISVGFLNANKMPLSAHEDIAVFYKKLPTYNPQFELGDPYTQQRSGSCEDGTRNYGKVQRIASIDYDGKRFPRSILKFSKPTKIVHPTQKPIDLIAYLIRTYTNESEVVLDNCAGSFTTALAAMNSGRNWICIEKEEKYCKIGQERIDENLENINEQEKRIKLDI